MLTFTLRICSLKSCRSLKVDCAVIEYTSTNPWPFFMYRSRIAVNCSCKMQSYNYLFGNNRRLNISLLTTNCRLSVFSELCLVFRTKIFSRDLAIRIRYELFQYFTYDKIFSAHNSNALIAQSFVRSIRLSID